MAALLHRTTKRFLPFANTPDYVPTWRKGQPSPTDGDWIVNPDLKGVKGVERRYWKIVGNDVIAMDATERAAVDAAEAAAAQAARIAEARAKLDDDLLSKAIAKVVATVTGKTETETLTDIRNAIEGR